MGNDVVEGKEDGRTEKENPCQGNAMYRTTSMSAEIMEVDTEVFR